jgi:hypothetical protein
LVWFDRFGESGGLPAGVWWLNAEGDVASDSGGVGGFDSSEDDSDVISCDECSETGERVCDSSCPLRAKSRVADEVVGTGGVVLTVRARVIRRSGFSDID